MEQDRRDFMKGAAAACLMAAADGVSGKSTKAAAASETSRGMAKGLALVTIQRKGEYSLGVKTERGILDVPAAAKLLNMRAPATLDDMLQNQDGPSVNALVNAALKSKAAGKAFLKEESIEYGPLVTRPEKIVCVGLNYRKHAAEIGCRCRSSRCSSTSTTTL